MKKVILITALALILPLSSAHAEGKGKKRGMLKKLAKKLDLNETQKNQIREFAKETKQNSNCKAIEDRDTKFECKLGAKKKIREYTESVLDQNQLAKFKQMQEMRKKRMQMKINNL